MTNSTDPPSGYWEEDELDNPLGCAGWVFNCLTNEITVSCTVETADGEDAPWFDIRDCIESAVLLETVPSIPDCAFNGFDKLASVQISRSVASIGDEAFANCYKLRSLDIPDSVESIRGRAFSKCKFASIKIPRSVTSFKGNPFFGCLNLKAIDLSENPNFVFVNGVLMNKDKTRIISCSPESQVPVPFQAQ